ncbi:hypothetical protein H7X69_02925 [Candidatus Saccharibacteria bacterium]|nr:hypothetical protein [Candidatus Saccharibacteria bacterium]
MRISTKSLTLCFFAAILLPVALFSIVSAQELSITDEQIARIRSSCVSAKNTLNQLHASDALLRVNRGQLYESMSTKLMTRFNSRADSNRFDVKDLTTVAQSYGTALTAFRDDYKSYEVQLATALNLSCLKEPVSFYDAVAAARTNRAQVYADVVKLHQYINDYKAAFDVFATNFNKTNRGNK